MSKSLTPPSFLPAVDLDNGKRLVLLLKTPDLKPDVGTLLGMPLRGAKKITINATI